MESRTKLLDQMRHVLRLKHMSIRTEKAIVGILAELERSLIQERTKAGRAAAVARGVKMGRKPKLSPQRVAHARTLLEQGEDRRDIARRLKVSWRTVERALALVQ